METQKLILGFQKSEITEYHIYKNLIKFAKGKNKKVLSKLSKDELKHYTFWKEYTKKEVSPNKLKIFFYTLIARILGLTFAVKLMEAGEKEAEEAYAKVLKDFPSAKSILKDEEDHENALVRMISEESTEHIGSMVLGINDALVEITGTLAGLTFALQNTAIVGLAGLITGISATLSMAASEYLSKRTDDSKNAFKAASYTGFAYLLAVAALVSPYFILKSPIGALAFAISNAIIIIFAFTLFTSVIREVSFKKSFLEMVSISLGVAFISFVIGILARKFLNTTS
ncbi:MAG: rubrerythrin family protein [Candidatus Altiarchaeota archaeon]|nr:rubrerythrin family protein [Candidatus Altiarchaeota archaeon]